MSAGSKARSFGESWEGFLPPHAIVMGRAPGRQTTDVTVADVPSANPSLVFAVATPPDAESTALLLRMIEALGLQPGEVPIQLASDLVGCPGQLVVAFGAEAARALTRDTAHPARGELRSSGDIRILPTHGVDELRASPALKKEVWADLQLAARELGIMIPTNRNSSSKG